MSSVFQSDTRLLGPRPDATRFAPEPVRRDAAVAGSAAEGSEAVFVTRNPEMLSVLETARKVARSDANLLILGGSGTGKECLARYVHRHSQRPESPYLAVNCAALPESLAESELFGHERGAFTGAAGRKAGKFEAAGDGTLVLDEISEMPLALQAKLLRVLQEREIDRVGGGRPIPLRCRVIAISNVDLEDAVRQGRFRQDLYYRINVIALQLTPLSRRPEDIPDLVSHFLGKYAGRHGRPVKTASARALELLASRAWPGNVRELENAIERAVLLYEGSALRREHLHFSNGMAEPEAAGFPTVVRAGVRIRDMERHLIFATLEEVQDNRARAAEMLGISIRTLRNKLNAYRESRHAPSSHPNGGVEP